MSSERARPPTKIAAGKFQIGKKLGAGCFGEVYRGHNTVTQEEVAVKFEDFQNRSQQLEHEADILEALLKPKSPQGFAQSFYFGQEGRFQCMVIELLGRSLEDRMQQCRGNFNVKTTTLVAEQCLKRMEYLHSKCIIHRDIKPENFMFGIRNKIHHLYLIDFGLSKAYYRERHVPIKSGLTLTGTARYASINTHRGIEQSRRDDLESIGHMLIYFLRGSLPWSGLEARTQEEKYRKIREKKETVPLKELCQGFPDAFQSYLQYCRSLEFKARPNYMQLRKLFKDVRQKEGPLEDHHFQWLEGRDSGALAPLENPETLAQPDDGQAPKRGFSLFFLCGRGSANKVRE
mmetsp:Transcript_35353/g.94141  ORF Transcript_35353/g.94141 Transcript_35353/m.94141 type:complete len:346 (-) Transcript_35353:304-1341(-)